MPYDDDTTNQPLKPAPRPALALLNDALEQALVPLTAPNTLPTDRTRLKEQAALLDQLFRLTLARSVGTQPHHRADKPHYMDDERLALALKAQRQCESTIKALHTIDYMGSLSDAMPASGRALQNAMPASGRADSPAQYTQEELRAFTPPTPENIGERTRNEENGR